MRRNTRGSLRTEREWFNVSAAPHHSDKGTASTITMKEDSLGLEEISDWEEFKQPGWIYTITGMLLEISV